MEATRKRYVYKVLHMRAYWIQIQLYDTLYNLIIIYSNNDNLF